MNSKRKSFLLSRTEPSASSSMQEIIRLVREGWTMVESTPVLFANSAADDCPSALARPANFVVLEDRRGTARHAIPAAPKLAGGWGTHHGQTRTA